VPRTKQRTPELRDRILAVALDLLAAVGPSGFTTRSLAARADTSASALYELFRDKAGVVRELYFEGFRQLSMSLPALTEGSDPVADLWNLATAYRRFVRANRELADIMFARPFADFSPGPQELVAAGPVTQLLAGRVRRCVEGGRLRGDETDIAHVLEAVLQGMAFAEASGRLGPSTESIERRWRLAIGATLNGLGARAEENGSARGASGRRPG
jgi:AcrR family transcriptional regulator